MLSEIQTFGECLSGWMEEKGLTPSMLAAYTRETRDATVSRLMHDQLDYQRCARYITELAESYPDIDEDTLKKLRISVDVNRYGKEMYLAKQNFFRMITGEEDSGRAEYTNADCLCDKLLAWSEGKSLKLLCMGLTDIQPQRFLRRICTKRRDIRVYDFYDRTIVSQLSGLLAETLPIAFNPNYELYEIYDDQGIMMNNIMIARRGDGAHLLIVHDCGEYSTLPVSKDTDLFDFCFSILLARHHTPKKINCHFTHDTPDAYIDFLSKCLSLEKDKAIYQIKSEVGLEYVPTEILFDNFCEWASQFDLRFMPFVGQLKKIFANRYENIYSKKEPTYLIMTKEGMTEFARTGRMKDHPFCLRPFSPDERKAIFGNLLKTAELFPLFTPLILSDDSVILNYSFIGYSRENLLVCTARADYNLSDYTEIVLASGELAGQYADFVTGILIKNHVLSKKASLEFIRSLMNLIPEEN